MLKPISYLFLFFKGIIIGVANIIPGVSGGTMAVVLGIYDELVESIGGFFTDSGKRLGYFVFLLVLLIGAAAGLKGLAPVISFCLDHHLELTMLFFMGLITGSMPAIIEISGVKKISLTDMVLLSAGICLVLVLGSSPENKDSIEASASNVNMMSLFIAGVLAGGAMIVPGVSGSLVLVLLGAYPVLLYAADSIGIDWLMGLPKGEGLDILKLLLLLAGGGCLGILLFSVLMKFLLKHAASMTHAFIFGLVAGSVIILYKGFPEGAGGIIVGVMIFILGSTVAHGPTLLAKTIKK